MATICTVAGVDRTAWIKRGSVSLKKATNGQDTFSCIFVSRTAGTLYRPTENDEILYEIDGSLPCGFGGRITSVTETAVRDPDIAWAVKVDAVNFTERFDDVLVDDEWVANGLWDRAYHYFVNYLQPRWPNMTYGPPTSGGPSLEASVYQLRSLRDVAQEWCDITGYVFFVGGDELWNFSTPGAASGPVALSETNGALANGSAQGVTRRRSSTIRKTRGYIRVAAPEGTPGDAELVINGETHGALGTTRELPLMHRPVVVAPTQIKINGAGAVTLPNSGYSYDASRKAIVRSSNIPPGTTIEVVTYTTKWPITYVYDTQIAEIREAGVEDAPQGTTLDQARQLLRAKIDTQISAVPQEAVVTTREPGFYIAMSASLNFPVRGVSGTYWVASMDIKDDPKMHTSVAKRHWYTLHCVEGSSAHNPWQNKLRSRLSGGGSSSSGTYMSGGGGGGAAGLMGSYNCHTAREVGVMSSSVVTMGAAVWLNGDMVPLGYTVRLRVSVRTSNAATSVTARLRRTTGTPADVATGSASTSTSWVDQFITFTPIGGWHAYELQVSGSNANNIVFAVGGVDVLA